MGLDWLFLGYALRIANQLNCFPLIVESNSQLAVELVNAS